MSKSKAFVFVIVCIMAVFLGNAVLLILGKVSEISVSPYLVALVSMGSGFIGFQVANNGVRGKWFNEGVVTADKPEK